VKHFAVTALIALSIQVFGSHAKADAFAACIDRVFDQPQRGFEVITCIETVETTFEPCINAALMYMRDPARVRASVLCAQKYRHQVDLNTCMAYARAQLDIYSRSEMNMACRASR